MNADDWKYWRGKKYVRLWEACLLALDCDPRVTDSQGGFDFDRDCGANTWTPPYFCELLQYAAIHLTEAGPLFAKSWTPDFPYQVEIELEVFGRWIAAEGQDLPEKFPGRIPPSLTKRTEIATRERGTLERVIKAMEMEAGLELSDDSSGAITRDHLLARIKELMEILELNPNTPWKTAVSISMMVATHGLEPVSESTISKRIQEIFAPLDSGPNT